MRIWRCIKNRFLLATVCLNIHRYNCDYLVINQVIITFLNIVTSSKFLPSTEDYVIYISTMSSLSILFSTLAGGIQ